MGVHESDGGFAGDGDVERVAAARQRRPVDAHAVQGVGKELPDVVGFVGEEIPGVLIALALTGDEAGRPVRDATAVGVDEPADEFPRVSVDDFLLPGFEDDRALVLLAGAVLRKQAVQVFRLDLHVAAACPADATHGVVGEDRAHGLLAVVHESGPCFAARDHEVGHAVLGVATDVAVAQIQAE